MIVIGSVEGLGIQIKPLRNLKADGFCQADVKIKLNSFVGQINAYIEHSDFNRFLVELIVLNQRLKGKAELRPIEDQFSVCLIGDGLGHISVEGHAFERASHGSCLNFEFEIDQSYLPEIIKSLQTVV
ncbi:hypothetical protein [Motilimonas sp. E26]|uniref:WapI family immunity protein n=1 Tax=Motilimonas sp. E26 TaxID=2865674 RepID=UPI001E5D68C2|nr:hypothetical protein [Motilimonas sp. E26]MCE0556672.1 hypothetical protein [Motilimonas sp. E26]